MMLILTLNIKVVILVAHNCTPDADNIKKMKMLVKIKDC